MAVASKPDNPYTCLGGALRMKEDDGCYLVSALQRCNDFETRIH